MLMVFTGNDRDLFHAYFSLLEGIRITKSWKLSFYQGNLRPNSTRPLWVDTTFKEFVDALGEEVGNLATMS